ncbi:unnamed protein product, partial [Mesorhabditis belari]|uniref:Uncharacterized protein n=1 Tax=Mesorhabditis belari TaxID=2138241 RepID=A0AAF3JB69_9BILA
MDVAVNNTLNFAESFFIFELGFVPIEMAINGFAFFIVVKHTPEKMKEYRKYLITVQSLIVISLMANICGLMSTLMYRRNQMLPPGNKMKLSEGQMRIVHFGGILGNIINCTFFVIASQDNAGPLGATFFLFMLPMGFSFIAIFIHIDVNILEQLLSYLPCFHSTAYTLILLIYTPVYFDATLCYLRIKKRFPNAKTDFD